jgi:hypothetical protein
MHREQRESFVKRIVKIAENARDPRAHEKKRSRFISREGTAFRLTGECLDLWDDILEDLLIKNDWNKKFSEKYVDSKLQEIISKIIKDENSQKAFEYFDQLTNEYDQFSKEHILHIPLFGIELNEGSIKIGNLNLKKMDDKNTDELVSRLEHAISKTSNTDEEKQMYFEQEKEDVNKFLRNKVCAVITVTAEPERALEIAEAEAQRTIDLLRYAIPAIYSGDKRVIIGLQGEYSWQTRYVPIIAVDGSGFNSIDKVVGPLYPLELSTTNLKCMRKIGVFSLGELLEKGHLNNFEETLLLGIEWFSRSQTQPELKNKLLNLITVLETFLTPGSNDPIQKSIQEGIAILLENDVLRRKRLMKRVKTFYGLRSKLSHGHGKAILDADVKELSNITGSLIMTLVELKDQFESKEELINWLEYRKLGGSPEKWSEYKESLRDLST